jgi:enoyl-CoA hydratase/carnithine racemase
MAGDRTVRVERDGPVTVVTIDRPRRRNAVDAPTAAALAEEFRAFDRDEAAAAVLTGAGGAFCAGADLKEMAALAMTVPPRDMAPHLGRNLQVTKPVVAAVNGVALGGGFLLAMMCDLCVAASSARFGITEARWGRGAPWAAPLPWLVPPRVALELLLTGEPIDARRAHEVGLVNRVVPDAALRQEAGRLAAAVAANAPLSVRAAKAMVQAAAGRDLDAAIDEGWRLFEPVYRSEDAQEGPRAFLEKRPPVWKGR